MKFQIPLRGTIVLLLALFSHSLTAQLGLVPLPGCTSDVVSPVPDNGTRHGWREYVEVISPDGTTGSQFGTSVAIHGNYAVVGAPAQLGKGAAYVYFRTLGGWKLQATLTAADGVAGDHFGSSVAIHGNRVMVGAPRRAEGPFEAGAVYAFERTGSSWSPTEKLIAIKRSRQDRFGTSLSLGADGLIVGAMTKETGSKDSGSVYYFTHDGATWIERQQVSPADYQNGAAFGHSVDHEGGTLAVGAYRDSDRGNGAGAVYLYTLVSGTWTLRQKIYASDAGATDNFGSSVSIDDNRLAVGAPRDDAALTNGGATYLFTRSGATWTQAQKLGTASTFGRFGRTVALSGDSLLVGSPHQSTGLNQSGAAHLYRHDGSQWVYDAGLSARSVEAQGHFGSAVALDRNYLLVGGDAYDGAVAETGAAFFIEEGYLLPAQTLYRCQDDVTATTALATDACVGSVMGHTDSLTVFDAAGSYEVIWNFVDGSGNYASAVQEIVVTQVDLSLPFHESVEPGNLTRDCWSANNLTDEGLWKTTDNLLQTLVGTGAFTVEGSSLFSHRDALSSPHFSLQAGKEYLLSFQHRTLLGIGREGLNIFLVDAADGSEVKQLYRDDDESATGVATDFIFTVPTDGNYRLRFEAWGGILSPGLILDELLIQEHTVANGWPGLSGSANDACTPSTAKGLDGYARSRFFDADGKLIAEIDPNGNDLGDVAIAMTDYNTVQIAPFTRGPVLSRYFDIVPENGSGPYLNNGGVKVRLYFSPSEIAQFNQYTRGNKGWGDLIVLHYSDANQDCDVTNSTGDAYSMEALQSAASFSNEGNYLEFATTSFSEFSASSETASTAALPVQLTDFSAGAVAGGNRLDWWVQRESGFSHYEVERSTEGRDFEYLTTVAGRQLAHYSATDRSPYPSSFYRLRMVDFDGNVVYSKVVFVAGAGRFPGADGPQAFPVPTHDITHVKLAIAQTGTVHFRLLSPSGRTVRDYSRIGISGVHLESVDLSDLPPGAYLLNIRTQDEVHNLTVVRN